MFAAVFQYCLVAFLVLSLGHAIVRKKADGWSAYVVAWLTPFAPIFNLKAILPGDYTGHAAHTAMAAYQISIGTPLPSSANTLQIIGDPTLALAGWAYYLTGGYLTLLYDPAFATRMLLIGSAGAYTVASCALARRLFLNPWMRLAFVIASTWSIYAMNNLYVRGAETEFVATALILAAFCILPLWSVERDSRKRFVLSGAIALCYGFAALTHPITAVYSAIALALFALGLFVLLGIRSRIFVDAVGVAVCILAMLSPWLYNVVADPPGDFAIARTFSLHRYPQMDNAIMRLIPFPISTMSADPIFFTPMNTGLLMFAAWLLRRHPFDTLRRLISFVVLSVAFLAFFVISVSPVLDTWLPTAIKAAQYGYRSVTYLNLFAVALIVALTFKRPVDSRPGTVVVLVFAVTIAAMAVMISHGWRRNHYEIGDWWTAGFKRLETPSRYPELHRRAGTNAPLRFDYSSGCTFATVPEVIEGCPTEGFAQVSPLTLRGDLPATDGLVTNVLVRPWNKLSFSSPGATADYYFGFYRVKSPTPVIVSYRYEPPFTFLVLQVMSVIFLTLGAALITISAAQRTRGVRRLGHVVTAGVRRRFGA